LTMDYNNQGVNKE